MRFARPAGQLHVIAFVLACAIVSAHAASPQTLPPPLRDLVSGAVDVSAHAWLWVWGEPFDGGDLGIPWYDLTSNEKPPESRQMKPSSLT